LARPAIFNWRWLLRVRAVSIRDPSTDITTQPCQRQTLSGRRGMVCRRQSHSTPKTRCPTRGVALANPEYDLPGRRRCGNRAINNSAPSRNRSASWVCSDHPITTQQRTTYLAVHRSPFSSGRLMRAQKSCQTRAGITRFKKPGQSRRWGLRRRPSLAIFIRTLPPIEVCCSATPNRPFSRASARGARSMGLRTRGVRHQAQARTRSCRHGLTRTDNGCPGIGPCVA
jgi:hypothetical protein